MDRSDVYIASVGTALPGPPVDNATLVRAFGMPTVWEQWIDAYVGTRTRHFCRDLASGEIAHSLADLGERAGRTALERAGVAAADIEVIIMASATPDDLMPATVNVVADRLGIDGIPSFQILSGCTGAVQALSLAESLLRSGIHRTALVLGGDTCAKHLDLKMDLPRLAPDEQINAVLFGDGVGAAVVTTLPCEDAPLLRRSYTRLAGLGRPPGQIVTWYGTAGDHSTARPVVEDFKAVENSAPVMAASTLVELLDSVGWSSGDLSYLLPPQLSGRMTERVTQELAVPGAEEVSVVTETGNTANALPFFQLDRVFADLAPGDRVAGVSVEASKWIRAGYALEMPVTARTEA